MHIYNIYIFTIKLASLHNIYSLAVGLLLKRQEEERTLRGEGSKQEDQKQRTLVFVACMPMSLLCSSHSSLSWWRQLPCTYLCSCCFLAVLLFSYLSSFLYNMYALALCSSSSPPLSLLLLLFLSQCSCSLSLSSLVPLLLMSVLSSLSTAAKHQ